MQLLSRRLRIHSNSRKLCLTRHEERQIMMHPREQDELAAKLYRDAKAHMDVKNASKDFRAGRELLRQAIMLGSMQALDEWHLMTGLSGRKRE